MQIRIHEKRDDEGRFGFFPGSALLLSPFAKILSGLLLAGLLASSVFLVLKIFETKDLKLELSETQKNYQHVQSEYKACLKTVDDQNSQIAQIKAESDRDLEIIKKVNEELNNIALKQRREIDKLKSTPPPRDCDETAKWLKDNLDIFEVNQ